MNDALILILSIISFLVIYWVLIGQRKHINQIRSVDKESQCKGKEGITKNQGQLRE